MALYRLGGGWRVLLYRRGVLYDNLILSTWGDYVTVHRKEIYQLTYRALALRQSKWNDSLRRRVNTWNFSFRNSLRWTIYIINAVDKTKLSWQEEWQTGRRKIERTDRKTDVYTSVKRTRGVVYRSLEPNGPLILLLLLIFILLIFSYCYRFWIDFPPWGGKPFLKIS